MHLAKPLRGLNADAAGARNVAAAAAFAAIADAAAFAAAVASLFAGVSVALGYIVIAAVSAAIAAAAVAVAVPVAAVVAFFALGYLCACVASPAGAPFLQVDPIDLQPHGRRWLHGAWNVTCAAPQSTSQCRH